MPSVVADTHAVWWYLEGSRELSKTAYTAMRVAISEFDVVYMSSVTIVELTYLSEKKRISRAQFDRAMQTFRGPDSPFHVVPLTLEVAEALAKVSVRQVPDMPDRIICATALHLGLSLVSRDRKILAADVETIW